MNPQILLKPFWSLSGIQMKAKERMSNKSFDFNNKKTLIKSYDLFKITRLIKSYDLIKNYPQLNHMI